MEAAPTRTADAAKRDRMVLEKNMLGGADVCESEVRLGGLNRDSKRDTKKSEPVDRQYLYRICYVYINSNVPTSGASTNRLHV